MVKRYYFQDYPENFKGDTETRTTASDFIGPLFESSLVPTRIVSLNRIVHLNNLNHFVRA